MYLKLISFYKFLITLNEKIINKLIPFFVKHKMMNLLCILVILNLKKMKEIGPQNKVKYKVFVLSKSGGVEDLICSQKKNNKNILYINFNRSIIKRIYEQIYNDGKENYLNKKNKEILKRKYFNFLIEFLYYLKKKYPFHAFIGFNFNYFAEVELHRACGELKIPFLVLYKESVITDIERKYQIYAQRKTKNKFEGSKVAVYSDYAKKNLIASNFVKKNKVKVVGCSRLRESFDLREILPENQIIYYAIQSDRGLPHRFIKKYGNYFFKEFSGYKFYNPNSNWDFLHLKTLKVLKKYAIKNPHVSIIIKIKNGSLKNDKQYLNLPKNINLHYYGTGHGLLKKSKIVIGWNTTAVLEGIASNRFILIPYFHSKNIKKKKSYELILNLKKQNYGFTETDFYKKLDTFVKKQYEYKKTYNNLTSLKFYLGNKDNKAHLRLDSFLKDSIK